MPRLFSRKTLSAKEGSAKEVEVVVEDGGPSERERLDAEWAHLKQSKQEFEEAQNKANRLIRQERANLQIEWEQLHRAQEEVAAQREQLNESGQAGLYGLDRDRNSLVQALRKGKERQAAKDAKSRSSGRERESGSGGMRMRFSLRGNGGGGSGGGSPGSSGESKRKGSLRRGSLGFFSGLASGVRSSNRRSGGD